MWTSLDYVSNTIIYSVLLLLVLSTNIPMRHREEPVTTCNERVRRQQCAQASLTVENGVGRLVLQSNFDCFKYLLAQFSAKFSLVQLTVQALLVFVILL